MDVSRTAPIVLAERRLAWLDARQRVLAENIANADTPQYKPRDLPDFAKVMERRAGLAMSQTSAAHLTPAGGNPRAFRDRLATDAAPNGNAVSLDREALKVADTDGAHALTTNLHKSWLAMFGTTLGR